ncbi:MAG: rhodanese-like domain-containing protein [Alloprevotella sp.]|nr:rhodanese-like domain-containing protein [Alloprevotella sp.]MBR6374996.1 rhodanese-like domain-containing protein [Alloprevotella sp.]
MKYVVILLLLCVAVVAWAAARKGGNEKFPSLEVEDFEAYLLHHENAIVLDVRTKAEYDDGHLIGAKLIDVNSSDFMVEALRTLPQDRPIAVYCRSGRRSAKAADMLVEAGWRVVNLKGGYMAWTAKEKPIEK